jgi:type IV secretory pathway TrbD component
MGLGIIAIARTPAEEVLLRGSTLRCNLIVGLLGLVGVLVLAAWVA